MENNMDEAGHKMLVGFSKTETYTDRQKACPFCGSTDISEGEVLTSNPDGGASTQSMCRGCGALGPDAHLRDGEIDYGSEKATAAWNRRVETTSADLASIVEQLALKHIAPNAKTMFPHTPYRERDQYRRLLAFAEDLLGVAPSQPAAPAEQPSRTDQEIVEQTERVASLIALAFHGSVMEAGHTYRDTKNPKAALCWQVACKIQDELTQTDVENAITEIEDRPAAPAAKKRDESWLDAVHGKPAPSTAAQGATLTDSDLRALIRKAEDRLGIVWFVPDDSETFAWRTTNTDERDKFVRALFAAAKPVSAVSFFLPLDNAIHDITNLIEMCLLHGDFSNGVTDPTGSIDEGEVKASEVIDAAHRAIKVITAAKPVSGNDNYLRNALEHIAGSCEGRAAEVARAALASVDAGGMTLQQAALAHVTEQGAAACVIPIADTELIVAVGTRESLVALLGAKAVTLTDEQRVAVEQSVGLLFGLGKYDHARNLRSLLAPTSQPAALVADSQVGLACLEKLRDLMVRLGVAPGEGGMEMDRGTETYINSAELALFRHTVEQFEDCNETDTPDECLMRWANMGLLECTHYEVTEAGRAALTPPTESTGEAKC